MEDISLPDRTRVNNFPSFSERVREIPFGHGILAFQTMSNIGIKTNRIMSWESVSKFQEAQTILRPKDHSIKPRCRLVLLHDIKKLPQPLLIKGLWRNPDLGLGMKSP